MNFMKQNLTKHFVLIALVAILGVIVGCTASLHNAARLGYISDVGNQLDKGVDVNARGRYGRTALMGASSNGHLEITKLLIERGADINAKDDDDETALSKALEKGHLEIAKLLIERGADINARDDNGRTVLMKASEGGHLGITKLLIERGADINARDDNGRTVLMKAAWGASCTYRWNVNPELHEETIEILIERGADINAKDDSGGTALMTAAYCGCGRTVRLLIERGADINSKNNYDHTACMIAAWQGHIETVKLLIDKGADINIPSGKAIVITESDSISTNIERAVGVSVQSRAAYLPPSGFLGTPVSPEGPVYLEEIDGRQIESGPGSMTTLSPGVHNIKVRYSRTGIVTTGYGEPISFSINVKSGHIYGVKHKINVKGKKWTAWIEKIK